MFNMFGSPIPKDEFRLLLKEWLSYSEETGEVSSEEDLAELAALLGSEPSIVLNWTRGLARPTPPEELTAITMLKALKTFE